MGSLIQKPPKVIAIHGSTGTIGRQALEVIALNPGRFRVSVLTAQQNIELLVKQALHHRPDIVVVGDGTKVETLRRNLEGSGIQVWGGRNALLEAATVSTDITVAAIVGMAGLEPTLAALEGTRCLAIANKESIVAAGQQIVQRARSRQVSLIPVDSEHNGLFQLLEGKEHAAIDKIVITASGGPFRGMNREQLKNVTLDQALKHPNWQMGVKNTIDSATLVNKGLEFIEASLLFGFSPAHVEAWVHPQSIVHGLLHFKDGSTLMQASRPSMCVPIAHALMWPERGQSGVPALTAQAMASLVFEEVDHGVFPAISIAKQCLEGGTWSCVAYNTANEDAVQAFVDGRISFLSVMSVVQEVLGQVTPQDLKGIEDILLFEKDVRSVARKLISQM